MLLYMYIAPGQGQTTTRGQTFDVNRKPLSLCQIIASLKKTKSDFILILNDFIYVYSPGARTDNASGTNFWCQQKALITLPICCRFKKKMLWNPILYTFFFLFHNMYIALGRGRQSTGDKILMTTERPSLFAHMLQVSKWSLLKSDFIHIFNDFIHVIAPGQGQKTPWGQTFDVNRKPLSLRPFVASFKQISLNSDFIHVF